MWEVDSESDLEPGESKAKQSGNEVKPELDVEQFPGIFNLFIVLSVDYSFVRGKNQSTCVLVNREPMKNLF